MVVSDIKSIFGIVRNTLSYGLGKCVMLYVFNFTYPTWGCQRINFYDGTSKR